MTGKIRLDQLLAGRGIEIRRAAALILSGRVIVNGKKETRSGISVPSDAKIEITGGGEYVSRSALKLKNALLDFQIDVRDRICVDLGCSNGGFTQVLLENGARKVYAVDVGHGILDYSLRNDPRVVVLEKRNVRAIQRDWFESEHLENPDGFFYTCDISFMSLRTVLNALIEFSESQSGLIEGVFLLKPQFEASSLTEKGIIRDDSVRMSIVEDFRAFCLNREFQIVKIEKANPSGRKGNQEFAVYLKKS